ncbi:MAG: DUF3159 domain-containing protein [Microbacteriaceae bacterium]
MSAPGEPLGQRGPGQREPVGQREPGQREPVGQREPSFGELVARAMRGSAFAHLEPGRLPSGRELLRAVGGLRGVVESVLPGLAFLLAFAVTSIVLVVPQRTVLLWSVGAPVALCALFLVVRLLARRPLRPAITGVLVAAVTAVLALLTGRAQDSFVPGIVINAVSLAVLLLSIAVRWPFIGVLVGALAGDVSGWRADAARRRVLTIGTWFWVGLFALRLAAELPLFLAGQTAWLAAVKLVLGVPFYALVLWLTWLFVSPVFAAGDAPEESPDEGPAAA